VSDRDRENPAVHVLLVEDDAADAALVRKSLESSGDDVFVIRHVTRLDAAASLLETEPIDIIVTDLNLPDSRGSETVVALRTLAPSTPLVVLTGSEDDDMRIDALRLGAIDFVPKSGSFKITLARGLAYALARTHRESRINDIVEANSDAAVVVDKDGEILYVNRAATRLFGRSSDELIGSRFGFPINEASAVEIELFNNGSTRTAEMRIVPLDWGDRGAFLASIRDITDRKRAAELERRLIHADRLASIGQLAAGVAHEINNPSTFIQANCSLMVEQVSSIAGDLAKLRSSLLRQLGESSAEVVEAALAELDLDHRLGEMGEMLADCVSGVQRITATVKDLSTFSRIEHDETETANVNHLVEVACNLVRNDLRHRAELIRDFEPVPDIVADRAKLTQVLVNLLVNASHALDDSGDNTVTVSTRHRGREIIVAVEDTGSGIPEPNLRRIFEPFFTTKTRDRGTGLGLSLAAETVRKHGGEISVDSQVGRGSRFELRLPEDTGLTPGVSKPPGRLAGKSPRARARLLIVDDEPLLRKAFRRVLTGHDVIEVESGSAALEVLRDDREFDMIICDLMMPNLDGPGLYEVLSDLDASLAERMVFVTGGAVTSRGRQFVADHRPIVLEKPVSREILLGIIDRIHRAPG
jgi:signal transduction histidine kinase